MKQCNTTFLTLLLSSIAMQSASASRVCTTSGLLMSSASLMTFAKFSFSFFFKFSSLTQWKSRPASPMAVMCSLFLRMNSISSSTLKCCVCLLSPVASGAMSRASTGYMPRLHLTSGACFFASSSTSLFVGTFTPEQIIALTPAACARLITVSSSGLYSSCVRWQWSSTRII